MNQTKKYRWNTVSKQWQQLDPNFIPSRKLTIEQNRERQWKNVSSDLVPDDVKQKFQTLIDRYTHKPKLDWNTGKKIADKCSAKEQEPHSKPVPLYYVHQVIRGFLQHEAQRNLKTKEERLQIVESIFDKHTAFGSLKPANSKISTTYDDYFVDEFFVDYITNYLYQFLAKGNGKIPSQSEGLNLWGHKQNGYTYALHEIATYLIKTVGKEDETEYGCKQYNKLVSSYDEIIGKSDLDSPDWSIDDYIKPKSETGFQRVDYCHIEEKKSKRYPLAPSWEEINGEKTPYVEMLIEQRELYDETQQIRSIAGSLPRGSKQQREVYKIANELQYKYTLMYEPRTVNHSPNKNRANDDETLDVCIDTILDIVDYTNPLHIHALILNYHTLWCKYQYQVDSPLYTILREFEQNSQKIEFRDPLHKDILDAFLYSSSTAKVNSKKLKISTEKMNRTLKSSISKKVAKYFSKHVGF
ncbi:hypothetical protein [Paenibacillus durus]|uniref:Uncharacterized protein n=1 Tax=Paenibacillus durus ATCC 35681 TaxID=1333534 RepID=A0A0F7CIE6_PAEDU|nr:hypothetical protein [Paenibacillus durus]AKG35261.1 hypothetical protein VK70_12300 [Paenibacillus durus ATCC 35681]